MILPLKKVSVRLFQGYLRRHLKTHGDWPPPSVDSFIVSFPKAGRTWLRVLLPTSIAFTRGQDPGILVARWMDEDLIDVNNRTLLFSHGFAQRTEYSRLHMRAFSNHLLGKRVVLMVRDPRDLIVSYYYQRIKRPFKDQIDIPMDIGDFVRNENLGVERIISFMNIWWQHLGQSQNAVFVSYESMHRNSAAIARNVLKFLFDIDVDGSACERAAEYSSFTNMREMELSDVFASSKRLWAYNKNDATSFKTREGVVGGYETHLSSADVKYIDTMIMRKLHPDMCYRNPGEAPIS